MATYPIKVLLDRARKPFIPFSTTSSIVENGTNRRLDKILGNLDDLQTNSKTSLVSAINEAYTSGSSSVGVNLQVVSKLPTDNISENTIYLVPHTGASKPNIYEEWVYINNDWELIGTTDVDLSGYATTTMVGDLSTLKTTDKDSVVDAVNELVDKQLVAGDGIELDGNVIKSVSDVPIYRIKVSAYMSDHNFVSIDQQDILKIEDKINKAYKNGLSSIGFIVSSKNNNEQYLLINNSNDIQRKPSTYWSYSIESVHNRYSTTGLNSPYMLLTIQLAINLSWTGDTCKVTSASVCKAPLPLLATSNTARYTPTADYHPATKKYVDDKVAEGSGSGVDLSNYLAKDNTTEFTPTGDYNPSTKKYVDDKFSAVPLIDSYTKTEVDTKLANYLAKDNLTEYTPTSDYHPATKKFVETVVASMDLSGYVTKDNIPIIMTCPLNCSPSAHTSGDYPEDLIWTCNTTDTAVFDTALKKYCENMRNGIYTKLYAPVRIYYMGTDANGVSNTYSGFRTHIVELKPIYGFYYNLFNKTTDSISIFLEGYVDTRTNGSYAITCGGTYTYSNNTWIFNVSSPSCSITGGRLEATNNNIQLSSTYIDTHLIDTKYYDIDIDTELSGFHNLTPGTDIDVATIEGAIKNVPYMLVPALLKCTTTNDSEETTEQLIPVTFTIYKKKISIKMPDTAIPESATVTCELKVSMRL